LFIPMLVYGQSVMTGIVQEKNSRVIEVLLSSVSPMTLLSGKILGIAAVGLTQLAAWLAIGGALIAARGALPANAAAFTELARADVALAFVVFFVIGYFFNVCVYAMAGAAANSQKEAQQLLLPATALMTAQWFVVMPV